MKKYVIMASILVGSLMPAFADSKNNPPEETVIFDTSIKERTPEASALKKIIEDAFKVSTNLKAADADYALHRSKDYVQYVDGKCLNYDEYVAHRQAIKKTVKSVQIVFHDMIFEGNKVVTRHTAHAIKNDGKEIEIQVIAIFEIRDGKIISLHELSHMTKGEKADRDLGSRK